MKIVFIMSIFLVLVQFVLPIAIDLFHYLLGISSSISIYHITSIITIILTMGMVFVPINLSIEKE